jgi:pimeloyl-ACP methyl ester carboxylesterase
VLIALLATLMVLAAGCGDEERADPPPGARAVTFPGPDGSELAGRELGDGDVAVVLAHGASTDESSWYSVMGPLAGAGYRVLAFDSRGVGESTGTASTDVGARAADIEAAIRHVRDEGADRVVLMGSSLGWIATLRVGETGTLDLAAIVGVSPPAIPLDPDAVPEPALFVASRGDTGPAEAARVLARATGRPPVIVSGSIHGAGLFRGHRAAVDELVAFVREVAPAEGR